MTDTLPTKRWTRREYDRLIEEGAFGPDDRIELLGGALVVREPQGSSHAMGIRMAEEALRRVFATGWDVRGRYRHAARRARLPGLRRRPDPLDPRRYRNRSALVPR
ncbi:MAG TPA: hypothetical protein VFX87_06560 [Methylomirabilota bacterium]|nr:hypothetical protein [Methylomirabilota bacterium]